MSYRYLSENRPPVKPDRLEAVTFLRPGTSWWADVSGNPVFVKPDGSVDENVVKPSDEEIDEIYNVMLEEWAIEESKINVRNYLNNITKTEWLLWKDIDEEYIPGKEGNFYNEIKDKLDKYCEKYGEYVTPYI